MGKNHKWNRDDGNDASPLRVCLFTSRNKDNKDVPNFRERRRSMLIYENSQTIYSRFHEFVMEGVPGEMSRMYWSVNARDPEKIRKNLIIALVANDNLKIGHINTIASSVAAKRECAMGKQWLIDVDTKDTKTVSKMTDDIEAQLRLDWEKRHDEPIPESLLSVHDTPNGYAIITRSGFDCREFQKKYASVATIKKDDLLCVCWDRKPDESRKDFPFVDSDEKKHTMYHGGDPFEAPYEDEDESGNVLIP